MNKQEIWLGVKVWGLVALSLVLVGYRPNWEAQLAHTCLQQIRTLESAAVSLQRAGVTVKGTGESVSVYPWREKAGLSEVPLCPVGREQVPAPLEYTIVASTSGELIVHCPVHGSREGVILFPGNPGLVDLVEKAKERRGRENRFRLMVMVVVLWGWPPALFATGVLLAGRRRMAGLFPVFRRLYLLPNYALLLGAIPGYILAPVPPAQELVKLAAVIAAAAVALVWFVSPIIASWQEPAPANDAGDHPSSP